MEEPVRPTFSNGKKHPRKCKCFSCDEYNYALIFWEKYQYENNKEKNS